MGQRPINWKQSLKPFPLKKLDRKNIKIQDKCLAYRISTP